MDGLKSNRLNIITLILLLILASFSLYFFILKPSLAPSDSSAANTGIYNLNLTTPSSLVSMPVGTNFTLALSVQNIENDTVGEIVISFDPTYLEATSIRENSNLLALNKNINNSSGILSIDIAQTGSLPLQANTTLVNFDFKIKNTSVQTTVVSVSTQSTLGYPNRLAPNGYGSVTLTLNNPPPANVCGDGNKAGSEECDNGVQNGTVCVAQYASSCNYCSSTCTTLTVTGAYCGDSVVNGAEQCDDGNTDDSDLCTNQCLNNSIGNSGPVDNGGNNPPPVNNPPANPGEPNNQNSNPNPPVQPLETTQPNTQASNNNPKETESDNSSSSVSVNNSQNDATNTNASSNNYDLVSNPVDNSQMRNEINYTNSILITMLIFASVSLIVTLIFLLRALTLPRIENDY